MAVSTRLSFSTNNGLYIEVLFPSPQPASQKRKSPALQELLAQHILEEVLHLELKYSFFFCCFIHKLLQKLGEWKKEKE